MQPSPSPTAPKSFEYVLNLARDAAGLADITVLEGEPRTFQPATYVILQNVTNHRLEIESLPYHAFQEFYHLEGYVRAFRGDTNFTQARIDAWQTYVTCLWTPITIDPRLGNNVEWCVPTNAGSMNEITDSGGSMCTIPFAFEAQARIVL